MPGNSKFSRHYKNRPSQDTHRTSKLPSDLRATYLTREKMATDFATFDVSTIELKNPKELKFINVIDIGTQDGPHLQFITPKFRMSMGVFAIDFDTASTRKGSRTTDLANATKVTIPLSIDLPGHDAGTRQWLQHMEAVDARIKKLIVKNATTWFGKDAALIARNIDDLYNSPVKPAAQYPAMFSPKVILNEDKRILTTFFDENALPYHDPINEVQSNCLARVRYEIHGVTHVVASNKFFVNVRAIECKTYPMPAGPWDDLDPARVRSCTIED